MSMCMKKSHAKKWLLIKLSNFVSCMAFVFSTVIFFIITPLPPPPLRKTYSVNIYGFCSITLIAFVRFCSDLHHTITINRGWRVIITRVMPLCNSYNKMFVLWLIVHILWNQLLLELSLDLFNTLQICYRHIEDVHEEVWCWKNIFW